MVDVVSMSVRASLVTGVLLLSACSKSGQQAGGAPGGAAQVPQVTVATVHAQPLTLKTELPGRASAYAIAEVRPQVGGILKRRVFQEGSDVKAGDVLYEINAALYQAADSNARAALAKAEANLTTIKLKTQRYGSLAESGVISKQDNDDVIASLGQAEADVTAAKAAVQTAQINLGYTKITAPISGRIGKSSVTAGALVTANQAAALATIQQLDPIYVDVTQTSAELLRLRRELASGALKRNDRNQAKVSLTLDDGSTYGTPGTLQFADVTVDEGTSSVILRASFPNPKHEILPGMYVRAVLEEGTQQNALLVSQQAVTRDPVGNATALVLTADGTVEQRKLVIERAIDNDWLVSDGIRDGEQVILEGGQRVKPGGKAQAITPAAAQPVAQPPAAQQ
ncbi:MAG: efflux RND transporter periplasmic adaptor subunit [Steroidobacteraceae bacterium]